MDQATQAIMCSSDRVTIDQLLGQLERIDLLLQQWSVVVRHRQENDKLVEFTLPSEEVSLQIASPLGAPHWAKKSVEWSNEAQALEVDSCDLLDQLVKIFDLTVFEKDVILLGLLPYFDTRYLDFFAALHGHQQQCWPSFELAFDVFCPTLFDRIVQEASFQAESPLLNYQLVRIDKKSERKSVWSQAAFITDISIYHFLTGRHHLPSELTECARILLPEKSRDDDCVCPPIISSAIETQLTHDETKTRPVMILRGNDGSGRASAIAAAAAALNITTLQLDLARLPENDDSAILVIKHVMRDVRMRSFCLILRALEEIGENRKRVFRGLMDSLEQPGLHVVCLTQASSSTRLFVATRHFIIDMPQSTLAQRISLLRDSPALPANSKLDIHSICRQFDFTAETLTRALMEAGYYSSLRRTSISLEESDLRKALQISMQQNFGDLAQRIEPTRTFDDLIVEGDVQMQLQEILAAAKYRESVLDYGFRKKLGYGTGISALFCGSSGTGKTMAAEVIAQKLGVDLIKIDLSAVVNKYIGETEKNISKIFDLAERDAGVLFFDEADALFGKRSAVTDAHDRHANIEVSYLLQRLEQYPGLVVLATNNRNHLDEAFSRRFMFITRFPFPDVGVRKRIWSSIWPDEVKLAKDVDFDSLAARAELTGANIRNIAFLATLLSKHETSKVVCLKYVERAMKLELAKIGRLANQGGR